MEYVGRMPAPPLDQFIDDIYRLTGVPRHCRMNVPPVPVGAPVHHSPVRRVSMRERHLRETGVIVVAGKRADALVRLDTISGAWAKGVNGDSEHDFALTYHWAS